MQDGRTRRGAPAGADQQRGPGAGHHDQSRARGSRRWSRKSRRPGSACSRSSRSSTAFRDRATWSKKTVQAANSSERGNGPPPRRPDPAVPRCVVAASRARRLARPGSAGPRRAGPRLRRRPCRRRCRGGRDHLGDRPERQPVPVGQHAGAVPRHNVEEAVDVLVELPAQPGLADAGHAGHEDESRAFVLDRRVEEVLDQAQLVVAPRPRGLQPVDPRPAAHGRDDVHGGPQVRGRRLALEQVLAGVPVAHRGRGHGPRTSSTHTSPGEAAAWIRAAVLTASPATMPSPTAPRATAISPRAPRRAAPVRGPRAARRTPPRRRRARVRHARPAPRRRRRPGDPEHRHDRVPDELLDRAAVPLQDGARDREVTGQQLTHLLGSNCSPSVVKPTRSANRTDASRRSALGSARRRRGRGCGGRAGRERAAAVAAKRWPGAAAAPQAGQAWDSGVPHAPQKRCPSGFSPPHAVHSMRRRSGSSPGLRRDGTGVPRSPARRR